MEPDWAKSSSAEGQKVACWCGLCTYSLRPVGDVRYVRLHSSGKRRLCVGAASASAAYTSHWRWQVVSVIFTGKVEAAFSGAASAPKASVLWQRSGSWGHLDNERRQPAGATSAPTASVLRKRSGGWGYLVDERRLSAGAASAPKASVLWQRSGSWGYLVDEMRPFAVILIGSNFSPLSYHQLECPVHHLYLSLILPSR